MIETDEQKSDGKRDLGVDREIKEVADNGIFRTRGLSAVYRYGNRDVAHMAGLSIFVARLEASTCPGFFRVYATGRVNVRRVRPEFQEKRTRPPRSNSADSSRGIARLHVQRLCAGLPRRHLQDSSGISVLRYELFVVYARQTETFDTTAAT